MQRLDPIVLGEHGVEDVSILAGVPWDPEDDQRLLRNVTVPTLTPFLPEPAERTGTGIVIAPGGGLHFLSVDNEGYWVAERLAERGIAAFVLHYRVAPTPDDAPGFGAALGRVVGEPDYLADVSRDLRAHCRADGGAAIRLVRQEAATWGVSPDRIGMLGFSAGAYVSLVTAVDGAEDERPSFLAPVYPAWWGEPIVPEPAPPMFLAWATDDGLGDTIVRSSLDLYDAWRRAGAPVEAHAYARGGHGFGIRSQGAPSDRWFDDFLAWLASVGR
jgi:acetyl esterase/lipase